MKTSWRANVARGVLGVVVGLGITEVGFRVRDRGAFPHLNVYVPDPVLGARLRPGATEKILFGSKNNPVTSVRVNRDGYRGEDWPAPQSDEVIVVGDSQVFGLGVEEGETFSAELARQIHAPVRNLGVPTYGPAEYNAVLAEQLEKRHGKTVIWVANLANDLFEAKRPNRDRHVVQDGWAIRVESAPPNAASFPGRSLLFGQSHAVVALRRRFFAPSSAEGFASEGTWRDIGAAANDAEGEHTKASAEAERLMTQHERDVENAQREARDEAARIEKTIEHELTLEEKAKLGLVSVDYDVGEPLAEESRSVRITARHIRVGADMRRRMLKMVEARARDTNDPHLLEVFAKRDTLAAAAGKLAGTLPAKPVVDSPLAPAVRQAKELCDRVGARLVVVALPLDVQVSPEEWKKYGAPPIDMSGSRVLNTDTAAAAVAAGAEGFDAFDTLAAAEPGAFLDGDIHMTAKGHRALAAALVAVLATKP